ncbi:GntR family transcriptional regulator [Amylibacter kogurei]|uniref:GntR family transcriptional regulator n=1 Tax=Paramylibacter kogurei TaxID=1889778 RepID=A0A2G5K7X7_9RHOB|nr:FCD domain-containing protein [Amylibacter kogurei]PIB25636.1 GntR family transcriptional regulator [Amylibacter kogurei]
MKYTLKPNGELSAQIALAIQDAIVAGTLLVDERLPSESELGERFGVARSTVREALKRLAAKNLIRTQRGASGGAFINRISFEDAYPQQITTSTLLLSMNDVSFETACEARYAAERACIPLAAQRCQPDHLAAMRAEIHRQKQAGLSDESFCASDVAFHRALVDGAGNAVLSYQLVSAIESMQPLMNMITFSERDRATIIQFHSDIADAIEAQDAKRAETALADLAIYTATLADQFRAKREKLRQSANAVR